MIKEVVDMLGRTAKDKVTGFCGVIATVSFDLYGCVQVVITPPVDKEGKLPDGRWFDVSRLVFDGPRVMPVPSFGGKKVRAATYDKGPTDKPAFERQ